ncbi:quinone oxidoreductase family protein [Phenylobacterium immobile]|uniref:quinone oxidoreductase family protein n=1 Tax=Phenylobacterium immobile TaxID=21 RepID=UPI000B2C995C|nr:NADP-dependent oxidoreductase [Phenylobacterium immobile]
MANAIQMQAYGGPEVLAYSAVELAPLGPQEVRIQTLAAALNHTDLDIRAGYRPILNPAPFPYTPGVEVVGVLSEVGSAVTGWAVGDLVVTMMQGLGGVAARRPGGYADFVTVDAICLAAVPPVFSAVEMAAIGLGAATAYEGLARIGDLAGKRVLVNGAAGGVGSSAVAIAKAKGASVLALVTRDEHRDYVESLGADEVLVAPRGAAPQIPTGSVDGVLDSVGGVQFGPCVAALRRHGVLSLVGAMGGGEVAFNAWELLKPLIVTGYASEELDGPRLQEIVADLGVLAAEKGLRAPDVQTMPIGAAREAHALLGAGGVKGRIVLVPD